MAKELDGNSVDESTLQPVNSGETETVGTATGAGGSSISKPEWVHTGSKRQITRGPEDVVIRTSETTSGIPEGTIDIEPSTKVTIPVQAVGGRKPMFTATGPGRTTHGYDWFEDLALQNNRRIGLTCDIPGGTYSHGEDGPAGTHFLTSATDNPFTTTPYVLCKHHLKLKQIQHAADPNIRFTPIKAQDVEKHLARLEGLRNSATGALESTLRTGGIPVTLPAGEAKPPKNVVLPEGDLLWGQETETKNARSGSLKTHLDEVSGRRSNNEKEEILTKAIDNLRASGEISPEEHDEHMEKYHSATSELPTDDSGNQYCPTCSSIYARTVDNAAEGEPKPRGMKGKPYVFSPKDLSGVQRTRKPGQAKPEAAPRVGQSLPSERATRESVPYGNLRDWEQAVLPAHMIANDVTGTRAVTPLERFAEEQLVKQQADLVAENADTAISSRNREKEAFRRMSRAEQIEHQRKKALEFKTGQQGPLELESGE